MKPTRLDYSQWLISSPVNYTITNMADHIEKFSHDAINRYIKEDKITPKLIWEHVKSDLVTSPEGYIIFDDTVLDKNHSHRIEMVRRQYSGNAHGLIKGIGVVNCIYVNPDSGQYWIVDYRIFDPESDGKSKIIHVINMLDGLVYAKNIPFKYVLMDSWYATKNVMLHIEKLEKIYYCPLKSNRLVDDSGGVLAYRKIDSLSWDQYQKKYGKTIKINKFPKDHKVKLFWVSASTSRIDWVVTNDLTQYSLQATQDVCRLRWKIEQFHRELKQNTGVEKCQCRKARAQRNHIGCAILVWIRMTALARKVGSNIYALKKEMLGNYLRNELKSPSVKMVLYSVE